MGFLGFPGLPGLSVERKIASGFLAVLLTLAAVRYVSNQNTRALISDSRQAARGRAVVRGLGDLLTAVQEVHICQREYLLAGGDERVYEGARRRATERLRELREQVGAAEAPGAGEELAPHPSWLGEVDRLAASELEELDRGMRLRRERGPQAAGEALGGRPGGEPGGREVQRLRDLVSRNQLESDGAARARLEAVGATARREFWTFQVSSVLSVGLIVVGYWLLMRYVAQRKQSLAEVEQLNRQLRRKVNELEQLFDVVPVGVVVSRDPECRDIRGNAVMARMLGAAVGVNLSKGAPAEEQPAYRCFQDGRELAAEELPMQTAAAGRAVGNFELDLVRPGRTVRLCGNAVPLLDENGKPRGAVGAFWDAEAFKQLQERLIDERDAAEAENAAKDDLLAAVSHDLRTPLHATLMWAGLIKRGAVSDPQRDAALDQITAMCQAQVRMIEDLLDMTRIGHGMMAVERSPMHLRQCVRAACEAVRAAADAKQVRLTCRLNGHAAGRPDGDDRDDPEHRDDLVLGDVGRLQQVFWNLLGNAIKFTPPGGEVRVELLGDGGHLCVRVTDTGCGIIPELLPHVFERFRRGGGRRINRTGLGLGLAIVRHLVELHGGGVTADSEGPGRGARFEVRLPSIPPPAPRRRKSRIEQSPPAADAPLCPCGSSD